MCQLLTCCEKDGFQIGDMLSSEIQTFLDEGSFGRVAQCIEEKNNKKVAVKIMKKKRFSC